MVFSTVSERPLSTSLAGNTIDITALTASPLAPSTPNSGSPLSLSPGVKVTTTDFIGDSLRTAHNVGDFNNATYRYSDRVSVADPEDFYRFQLNTAGTISIGLTGMSADADLYLLDGNGVLVDFSGRYGTTNEAIDRFLTAGVYYVKVRSFYGENTTDYSLSVNAGGTASDPGSTVATARNLGNLSRSSWTVNDAVGSLDLNDYYRFDLSENSNFHLSLTGLSRDVDVILYDRTGRLVASSMKAGSQSESIDRNLAAGTYSIRVFSLFGGNSDYSLRVYSDTPSYSGTRTLTGTLGADTFDVIGNYTRTIISGNGNVDFGRGQLDDLDLSSILSTNVTFNFANTTGGGVFYDPGNGTRVFDSILLSDGRQILFEGIDHISFSDRCIELAVRPNDPLFSQQWNLGMMNVQNAWRFTKGSSQVMVGIEDTGIAVNAQGTRGNDLREYWYNRANDYDDDFSDYDPSHGTAVQSIIASISDNGVGMTGINWNSDVYVTDVLGRDSGDYTLSEATQAMASFAASCGQRLVINLSLTAPIANLEAVVAANPNVLFVIAAGNNGHLGIDGIATPAVLAKTYRNVMAIGAVWGRSDYYGRETTPGTRIEYAGWWGSQYGVGLTLMGPSEVLARQATKSYWGDVSFDYNSRFNGTSAATPNVTGVASLVWSANVNLSATQVRDILSQTATDLGAAGYDRYYGNGFVNADAAVRRAIAMGAGYA